MDTMRRALVIAFVLSQAVAACGLGFGPSAGTSDTAPAPGRITGDAIEVTSLDAPAADAGSGGATDPALAAAPVGDPAPVDPADGGGKRPADDGAKAATPDPSAEVAAEPAAVTPPAPPKSKAQTTCERRGGRYAQAGNSGAKTCITSTRDGGKQCSRQGDCDGMCLARSNSCAPVAPLFGCNEILQADGRRVTLCID